MGVGVSGLIHDGVVQCSTSAVLHPPLPDPSLLCNLRAPGSSSPGSKQQILTPQQAQPARQPTCARNPSSRNSPTEVAPCRLDSLDLSGARIRDTWPNTGVGKPSAW